ncbi:MAG: hypothetical protein VX874_10175 [Pseudomonadota bacterium]|nr:hypothetical protein [Pseudomonadota bacterium]
MNHALTAALILTAAPALATCPSRADLREGIVLVQNEPYFIRADIELRPDGFHEVQLIRTADDARTVIALSYENALAPMSRTEGRETRLTAYDTDTRILETLPTEGDVTLSATDTAGAETTTRRMLFNHIGTDTRMILNCTYDVWTVRVMEAGADGTIDTRELVYAPDLGAVLAAHSIGPEGTETQFNYTWIGTSADVAR